MGKDQNEDTLVFSRQSVKRLALGFNIRLLLYPCICDMHRFNFLIANTSLELKNALSTNLPNTQWVITSLSLTPAKSRSSPLADPAYFIYNFNKLVSILFNANFRFQLYFFFIIIQLIYLLCNAD